MNASPHLAPGGVPVYSDLEDWVLGGLPNYTDLNCVPSGFTFHIASPVRQPKCITQANTGYVHAGIPAPSALREITARL